jgi:hypothetical protein
MECLVLEVERVKAHGFLEDELARVKSDVLSELETAFLEKDQSPSADLASECVEHFLRSAARDADRPI